MVDGAPWMGKVAGSNPVTPTTLFRNQIPKQQRQALSFLDQKLKRIYILDHIHKCKLQCGKLGKIKR